MTISRETLDAYVLELRLKTVELLLLKLHLLLPLAAEPRPSIDASLQVTLQVLEEVAEVSEQKWLSDHETERLDFSERAMLADEARELVEMLKRDASKIAELLKSGRRIS